MSFTCPLCGRTSHNPTDEAERYCASCHAFTDVEPAAAYALLTGESPSAIAVGARVRKAREDPGGDITPIGTLGRVMASHDYPEGAEQPHPDHTVRHFYFVTWDDKPGVPVGCADWKIEEVE